ncbi:ABC transporter permease [Alicyclobacillus sp. SP_1]|jgi:ABC-2 type transport system permease protein|uniref:ABC transporter permease n=1 Tax=Alicyclobacillus sp. SP_1 TaxID=2942475 RepID=UPI002156F8E0|nr:ABC transporter permease [Alicyclobacillus sp. SP_1]
MFSRIKEVYEYRTMFWGMVTSDLRTRYKGSVLGFLWTFLNPLLMLVVYSVVFSTIMRVTIPHYPAFMFIGLLAWNLFGMSVQSAVGVVNRQGSMVKKIYFPREILPLAIVVSSAINYIFSLAILIPFLIISGLYPSWTWLFVPLILVVECIATAGFALFFSAVNVFLRDVEHVLGIFLMAWFYVTPVVYSLKMIPHKYAEFFKINPVTDFVVSFQDALYYHDPLRWKMFLYGVVVSLVVLYLGWKVFDRLSRRFAEEV